MCNVSVHKEQTNDLVLTFLLPFRLKKLTLAFFKTLNSRQLKKISQLQFQIGKHTPVGDMFLLAVICKE